MLKSAFASFHTAPDTRTPQEKARDTRAARKEEERINAEALIKAGEGNRDAKGKAFEVWESLIPGASRKRALSGASEVEPSKRKTMEGRTSTSQAKIPAAAVRRQTRRFRAPKLQASDGENISEPDTSNQRPDERENEDVDMDDVAAAPTPTRALKRRGKKPVQSSGSEEDGKQASTGEGTGEPEDDDDDDDNEFEATMQDEAPFRFEATEDPRLEANAFQPSTSTYDAVKSVAASLTVPDSENEVSANEEGGHLIAQDDERVGKRAVASSKGKSNSLRMLFHCEIDAERLTAASAHRRVASLPISVLATKGAGVPPPRLSSSSKSKLPSVRDRKHQAEVPGVVEPEEREHTKISTTRSPIPTPGPGSSARAHWPKATRIVPPAKGSSLITLGVQPTTLQHVLSLAIVFGREHLLKEYGWPASTTSAGPFLISAAVSIRDDPPKITSGGQDLDTAAEAEMIRNRAENDPDYGHFVSKLIHHRQGLLRTQIKDTAAEIIPEICELEGLKRTAIQKKIASFLHNDQFAFPWDDDTESYDTDSPFCTEVIIATIALVALKGESKSLMASFPAAFKMTNADTDEEYPVIPMTLIGMAAVAIEFSLKRWSDGDLSLDKVKNFTAESCAKRYMEFMGMLRSAQEKSQTSFQDYMSRMYDAAVDALPEQLLKMKEREKVKNEQKKKVQMREKERMKKKEKKERRSKKYSNYSDDEHEIKYERNSAKSSRKSSRAVELWSGDEDSMPRYRKEKDLKSKKYVESDNQDSDDEVRDKKPKRRNHQSDDESEPQERRREKSRRRESDEERNYRRRNRRALEGSDDEGYCRKDPKGKSKAYSGVDTDSDPDSRRKSQKAAVKKRRSNTASLSKTTPLGL
ncbi:hypothetical protein BDN72DRAFT_901365 [Pluteus cervinus]|uniref:Uncharacterized protein n=1 Tax=Pluteus cervinus TaxID=181527 RepID=A0ACD3AG99_9AGAR|nr:hypothetical protein BDN72DRAFT_901365 [Pluteus cervinus]